MAKQLTLNAMAIAAMCFVGEDETFGVFIEWGKKNGIDDTFNEWIKSVTIQEFRESVIVFMAAMEGHKITWERQ